jgi:DNA-binding NarL/FixJ family response regulator
VCVAFLTEDWSKPDKRRWGVDARRPVIVFSDLPMFRAGVEAVLQSAGFNPELPDDALAWARAQSSARQRFGVIFPVRLAADFTGLKRFAQLPGSAVVAVLTHPEPMMFTRALQSGAAGCVSAWDQAERYVAALRAAFECMVLLPVGIAHEMSHRANESFSRFEETRELGWLRELARGATVAVAAASNGVSEREMYRGLRGLYERLGASGRVDAIGRAIHLGWIDGGQQSHAISPASPWQIPDAD